MSSSEWIESIIEENFKPCNLDDKARNAVKSLREKYNERLIRDSLQKAVRQARGRARQEDMSFCELLQTALDKNWLVEFCESYANPMID